MRSNQRVQEPEAVQNCAGSFAVEEAHGVAAVRYFKSGCEGFTRGEAIKTINKK